MRIDPTVMQRHNQEQAIAKERAIELLSGKPAPACPVEFAMVNDGLPVWAVRNAKENHEKI